MIYNSHLKKLFARCLMSFLSFFSYITGIETISLLIFYLWGDSLLILFFRSLAQFPLVLSFLNMFWSNMSKCFSCLGVYWLLFSSLLYGPYLLDSLNISQFLFRKKKIYGTWYILNIPLFRVYCCCCFLFVCFLNDSIHLTL